MKTIINNHTIIKALALASMIIMTCASPVTAAPTPQDKKATRAATGNKVSFNFVNVEITKVAEFVSDITGKNFIFDERVKGKVTIVAPTMLNRSDAYNLFTSVLQLKGFAIAPTGVNAYKIVPAAEAKQSGLKVYKKRKPINEDYIVRLIQFKNISADSALRFLQPLISRTGYISSFGPGNMVMVIDSGINLRKILQIVETIDLPSNFEEPEVVLLSNSSADAMATMLNQGVAKASVARKGAKASPASARAVADKRLNGLVLFGSKTEKEAMKRLIALLDVPTKEERGSINVYFLENAAADEMAKVLQGMVSATKQPARPARPGTPALRAPASPFQTPTGLSITPDKATNALVIIGSPSDYTNLVSIIKKLDRRRKQVYVEAMIVEASLDNLRDMGSRWRGTATHKGEPVAIGGVGTVDATTMQNIITGLSGMTLGGMTNYMDWQVLTPEADGTLTTKNMSIPGFAALFSMSEFEGVVNVLSSPQILTSDNTEAEIVVGENVPFVTKTETTTTTNPIKSIERKDVGIKMTLTPQITEGDYVKLDLYQEISSVKDSSAEVFTEVGPTTTKRSTKTTVTVQDNQTVVISGLMQEREVESETRVPLLHRIPLLGWLFKYRTTNKQKTNLLVFLTPHVIRDAAELSDLTATKADKYARAETNYVQGEIIVMFKKGVSDDRAGEIISKLKAEPIRKLSDRLFHIKLHRRMDVDEGVDDFMYYDEVEFAEPNYRMKALQRTLGLNGSSADLADESKHQPKLKTPLNQGDPSGQREETPTSAYPSWMESEPDVEAEDIDPEYEDSAAPATSEVVPPTDTTSDQSPVEEEAPPAASDDQTPDGRPIVEPIPIP